MVRLLAILALGIFLGLLLRPYLPYLEYAADKDRIARELCENKDKPEMQCEGRCHLRKEIKKAADPLFDHDDKNAPDKRDAHENIRWELYLMGILDLELLRLQGKQGSSSLPAYPRTLTEGTTSISTPPPECFI